MSATGSLVGIGVGPGDPDLITVKGLRALRAAPVLAYPAPETGESLARAIVAPHLEGASKIEIPIRMPMVAARFPAQEVYDQAARSIGGHLDAGRDVACLCEGDPSSTDRSASCLRAWSSGTPCGSSPASRRSPRPPPRRTR